MRRRNKGEVGSGNHRRTGGQFAPATWLLVVAVGTALPAVPPPAAEAAPASSMAPLPLPEGLPTRIDARLLLVPGAGPAAALAEAVVPDAELLDLVETAARIGAIGVPGDYPTIQAAIDAAHTGDTIVVSPGTYEEDIDFLGKGIVLESLAGPAATVIQGSGTGPVVRIDSEEPAGTTIRGFTITGGYAQMSYGEDGVGGGIYILGPAQALIENNYVTLNRAGGQGGGIAAVNSNFSTVPVVTEIRGNVIARNRAAAQAVAGNNGGGLYAMGESVIEGNTFLGNDGDGAYVRRGALDIDGNEFAANSGSGITVGLFTEAVVANNLMIGNLSGLDLLNGASSGFYNNTLVENGLSMGSDWNPGDFVFANNIIEPREGIVAIGCGRKSQADRMWNNDVVAEAGLRYSANCDHDRTGEQGNLAVDPGYRSRSTADLRLAAPSPLIDQGRADGAPAADFLGRARPAGAGIDIGAYEAPASLGSYGEIAGTVRAEETGDGAEAVCVAAFGVDSGLVAGAATDAQGRYRIRRVPAGDYLVQFTDCVVAEFATGEPPLAWVSAWYGGDTPATVTVASGATTTSIDADLFRMGGLRLWVNAYQDDTPDRMCVDLITVDGAFVARSTTDYWYDDSRYFEAPPGEYKVFVWDCLDGTYEFGFYASGRPLDHPSYTLAEGEVIDLQGGEVLEISHAILVEQAGAAGGVLTDTRTDRLLEGILVVVTDPSGFIVSGGLSAADGFYLVPGLATWDHVAGERVPHRIRYIDTTRAYNSEWWHDQPTLRRADVFVAHAGYYTPLDAGLLMRLRCGGVRATLAGTSGADMITGTDQADVIHAQGGKDVVDGGGGDDIICGGGGGDVLMGGEGADRLYGHIGGDSLLGGPGDDWLWGGPGSDLIEPGAGANTVDGGPGRDVLSYAAAEAAVLVDLAAATGSGWVSDAVAAIENVDGSPFDDVLSGDSGPNILRGLGGNDTLNGGEGDDRLFGGDGEDTADGGPGSNTCSAENEVNCLP